MLILTIISMSTVCLTTFAKKSRLSFANWQQIMNELHTTQNY